MSGGVEASHKAVLKEQAILLRMSLSRGADRQAPPVKRPLCLRKGAVNLFMENVDG